MGTALGKNGSMPMLPPNIRPGCAFHFRAIQRVNSRAQPMTLGKQTCPGRTSSSQPQSNLVGEVGKAREGFGNQESPPRPPSALNLRHWGGDLRTRGT